MSLACNHSFGWDATAEDQIRQIREAAAATLFVQRLFDDGDQNLSRAERAIRLFDRLYAQQQLGKCDAWARKRGVS